MSASIKCGRWNVDCIDGDIIREQSPPETRRRRCHVLVQLYRSSQLSASVDSLNATSYYESSALVHRRHERCGVERKYSGWLGVVVRRNWDRPNNRCVVRLNDYKYLAVQKASCFNGSGAQNATTRRTKTSATTTIQVKTCKLQVTTLATCSQ